MKAKRYLNRAHKGISVFLAVVMVFSVFTGMGSFTANAAAEEAEVYMIDFPRSVIKSRRRLGLSKSRIHERMEFWVENQIYRG